MTDDAERCGMFTDFVDALFAELAEGDTEDRQMPGLSDLDWVQPHLDVEVGAVSMGRVTVGGDAR